MAKLEVLKFPDPRLRKKSQPITAVTPELQQLAADMLETMYDFKGIGLAAAQVNVQLRLVVIDTRIRDEKPRYDETATELEQKIPQPLILFNPVITKKQHKTTYDEGCLSVPGYFETVERAEYIEFDALDLNGELKHYCTDGLLAICVQHEIDHLDGKLFIDRLSPIKSNRIKTRIKKYGYDSNEMAQDLEAESVKL